MHGRPLRSLRAKRDSAEVVVRIEQLSGRLHRSTENASPSRVDDAGPAAKDDDDRRSSRSESAASRRRQKHEKRLERLRRDVEREQRTTLSLREYLDDTFRATTHRHQMFMEWYRAENQAIDRKYAEVGVFAPYVTPKRRWAATKTEGLPNHSGVTSASKVLLLSSASERQGLSCSTRVATGSSMGSSLWRTADETMDDRTAVAVEPGLGNSVGTSFAASSPSANATTLPPRRVLFQEATTSGDHHDRPRPSSRTHRPSATLHLSSVVATGDVPDTASTPGSFAFNTSPAVVAAIVDPFPTGSERVQLRRHAESGLDNDAAHSSVAMNLPAGVPLTPFVDHVQASLDLHRTILESSSSLAVAPKIAGGSAARVLQQLTNHRDVQ